VSVVCDLRSADERAAEPSVLLTNGSIRTLSRDYELSSSLASLMGATNRAQAVEAFVGAYMTFITMLAPQFTEMFASLVESSSPVALNCTPGKDRTGVGSALILALLGVDRETIVADYALSQTYVPVSYYTNITRTSQAGQTSGGTAAQVSSLARLPHEVVNIILGSDPEIMRKTLVRIDSEYVSAGGLAKRRFGVTDAGIAQMRRKYLG
jgi:protein-tyrosine phosphatase